MDNIPNQYGRACSAKYKTNGGGGGALVTTSTDAFGRLRISEPHTLFDSQNRYKINEKFYSNTATGGTVTYTASESTVNLNVTTSENSFVARESKYVFNYQPGKSLLVLCTFVMNPAKTHLVQRVGYFGSENGYFLELSGSTIRLVERNNSSDTRITQTNWNVDRLDGTTGQGASGILLNLEKSQILFMDIEWLGSGTVRMGFVIDGAFVTCHVFHHANLLDRVYMTTACLPIRYEIFNSGGSTTSSSTLKQICATVMSEGGYEPREQLFCAIGPSTGKTLTSTTLIPLCTIRLASGRLDAIAVIKQVNIAVETNNDLVQWQLVLNGTLTGATYVASTGGSTNVEVDTAATAISGGRIIETGFAQFGSVSTIIDTASIFEAHIGRNSFTQTSDTISLCVGALSMNPKAFWSFAWSELL